MYEKIKTDLWSTTKAPDIQLVWDKRNSRYALPATRYRQSHQIPEELTK